MERRMYHFLNDYSWLQLSLGIRRITHASCPIKQRDCGLYIAGPAQELSPKIPDRRFFQEASNLFFGRSCQDCNGVGIHISA